MQAAQSGTFGAREEEMKDKVHPPSESTSQFIRRYLTENGKGYPYKIHRDWCRHLEQLGMKSPTFESFRKYFWLLKKLGLIRRTESPPYKQVSYIPRQYYAILENPRCKDGEDAWANPQVALYGDKMRLGRRRYRKRILKLPPKLNGRPKGSGKGTQSYD